MSTEKGFSLLEMLICMMMISSLSLVSLRLNRIRNNDHFYFLNDCMLEQSKAMRDRREHAFRDGIRFNSMGHINMARTIRFHEKKITLNLGSGYVLIR